MVRRNARDSTHPRLPVAQLEANSLLFFSLSSVSLHGIRPFAGHDSPGPDRLTHLVLRTADTTRASNAETALRRSPPHAASSGGPFGFFARGTRAPFLNHCTLRSGAARAGAARSTSPASRVKRRHGAARYNFSAMASPTAIFAASTTGAFVILGLTLLVVLPLALLVFIYNRLVTLRVRVNNAFAQIDVQLRRRYDLIPNLVSAVQGYIQHERATLEAVIEARANATQAANAAAAAPGSVSAIGALAAANVVLDGAVGMLFGLVERYPDLKASHNVLQLQEELVSTENRVAFARQAYNDAVMTLNTARQVFPQNIVAGIFGFDAAALYQADAEARVLPTVKL